MVSMNNCFKMKKGYFHDYYKYDIYYIKVMKTIKVMCILINICLSFQISASVQQRIVHCF